MELLDHLWNGRNVEEIEKLLKSGIDVNYRESDVQDDRKCHALHVLANCDDRYTSDQKFDILKLLIKYGADTNAPDSVGRTPLMAFLMKKKLDEECIICLLNNNADDNPVTCKNYETELYYYPIKMNYTVKEQVIFKMLLERIGDNINSQNPSGETPLMSFVRRGANIGCIQAMIDAGADVKCLDSDGDNIFKYFSSQPQFSKDRFAVFKALIDYGADVSAINSGRMTPLMYSIRNSCDPSFIHKLLQKGANILDTDHRGEGVLFHFCRNFNVSNKKEIEHLPILELLLDCGVNVDSFNETSTTPLLYLLKKRCYIFVEILFMNGHFSDQKENEKDFLFEYINFKSNFPLDIAEPFHAMQYAQLCKYILLTSTGEAFLTKIVNATKNLLEALPTEIFDCIQIQRYLVDLFPSFKSEMNKLKTEHIKEDLTLFKFCMENDRRILGRYFPGCSNDLTKFKKEFPNYFRLINYKLEVAEKWHNIMDKIEKLPFWCSTTSDGKAVHLHLDCLKHIMSFLTNYEIITLSSALE